MIINVSDFDFEYILKAGVAKRPRGNQAKKKLYYYVDLISAFDIETSAVDDLQQSFMYVWQWQIGEYTVIGRTWAEWVELVEGINSIIRDDNLYLVVFVHNLSYEFQFMSGIINFDSDDVFALAPHKILKATYRHIEFRCSMLHSNRSLKKYLADMGVEHQKVSGELFDYGKLRFSDTELSDLELEYCVNDVLGLCEAIKVDMSVTDDNLYTFPLTSTGYPRRDCKRSLDWFDRNTVQAIAPDYSVYKLLRGAFIGGNTHANRYFSGEILDNVVSFDRSSSYPDVICNCLFPMSPFVKPDEVMDKDLILHFIDKRKKACLIRFRATNVRLIDELHTPCPYLMRHKCRDCKNPVLDNGRLLRAEYIDYTVTDVDFKIIIKQYDWDEFEVVDFRYARYGKLPRNLINCVIRYYQRKTELKGVAGEELNYALMKAMLNSLYGMMAQNPVKQDITYYQDSGEFVEGTENEELLLEKYNQHAFLVYQWGCWVTAWARERLQRAIDLVGDNFVYCDTDSVKFVGDCDFTRLNEWLRSLSEDSGAVATDRTGKKYYMGVFEYEGSCEKFVTCGAKRYAGIKDGKLFLTVAGVSKKAGAQYLEDHGGLEVFKDGFVFRHCGKLEAVYNNDALHYEMIEGHKVLIGRNVYLREVDYTMGISSDYRNLLDIIKYYNIDNDSSGW